MSVRDGSPGGTSALDVVNKRPFAEPADAGVGVQLDALCAVGVANMRCATAAARIDIADDMLEPAEASALVLVLLAWLQAVVPSRLLEETDVMRSLKHPASLACWRWKVCSEKFCG